MNKLELIGMQFYAYHGCVEEEQRIGNRFVVNFWAEADLSLPAKDAQTITWLYSQNTNIQYCQLLNHEATRSNIISAMNRIFAKAGTNDIVVLFYSGHGYPGGFCAYDGNLSYNAIRKSMAKSKCKNKMIFADACFSGKIRTNGRSTSNQELSAVKKANVMLFLSSRSNEASIERRDMDNGFFTTYLQKVCEEELMLTKTVSLRLKNYLTMYIRMSSIYLKENNIRSCGVNSQIICLS